MDIYLPKHKLIVNPEFTSFLNGMDVDVASNTTRVMSCFLKLIDKKASQLDKQVIHGKNNIITKVKDYTITIDAPKHVFTKIANKNDMLNYQKKIEDNIIGDPVNNKQGYKDVVNLIKNGSAHGLPVHITYNPFIMDATKVPVEAFIKYEHIVNDNSKFASISGINDKLVNLGKLIQVTYGFDSNVGATLQVPTEAICKMN